MTKPSDSKPSDFEPFADEASVRTVGALSFENGRDAIAVHGNLDLTRDDAGLALARALKATVDAVVASLEGSDLPDAVAKSKAAGRVVRNPFA